MKKNYFITGGLGFIGKAISKSLLDDGHKVIILDNNFRKKNNFIKHKNLTIYRGDIREKKNLLKIKQKIHSVIHLAAINGTNHFYEIPDLVLDVGVKGMINILEFCKEKKIKEIFLASSSEVYQDAPFIPTNEKVRMIIPDPHNPRFSYSSSKIISEMLALHNNFINKIVIFRPHNIYGPDMGFNHVIPETIIKILNAKKQFTIQGNGKNKRSFCYIDDFIKGIRILLKKGKHKEIYNIGYDEETSINQLCKLIMKLFNKRLKIIKSENKLINTKRRLPDIKKLQKLGYKPSIKLNQGLPRTIEWYMKNAK